MMGFCGVSTRQKLLGYLSACCYANNEIGSESCQCINPTIRGCVCKQKEKKNCLQEEKKTVLVVSVVLKDMRFLLILKWLIHW